MDNSVRIRIWHADGTIAEVSEGSGHIHSDHYSDAKSAVNSLLASKRITQQFSDDPLSDGEIYAEMTRSRILVEEVFNGVEYRSTWTVSFIPAQCTLNFVDTPISNSTSGFYPTREI